MKNPRNIFAKTSVVVAFVLALTTLAISKTNSDPAFTNIKVKNFGQMDERFYRGARPKERDFQDLKALGIQTIIDLTDNTPQERAYAEAVGLNYVNIAIPDKRDPTDGQIAQFMELVNNPSTGKFYVHCAGGRHRTGVMGAVYRFNNYGWNFDQVYTEMKNFDFYTSNGHGKQKTFVENYAQRVQSESATRAAAQGTN